MVAVERCWQHSRGIAEDDDMLNSNIIETRPGVINWITRLMVVDSGTEKQYIHMLQTGYEPDDKRLADLEQLAIDTTQAQLDAVVAQENMIDADRVLEAVRGVIDVKTIQELKMWVDASVLGVG